MYKTNNLIFKILPASGVTKCNCLIKFSYYRPIFVVAEAHLCAANNKTKCWIFEVLHIKCSNRDERILRVKAVSGGNRIFNEMKTKIIELFKQFRVSAHVPSGDFHLYIHTICLVNTVYINFIPANDDRLYFQIQFEKSSRSDAKKIVDNLNSQKKKKFEVILCLCVRCVSII